MEFTHYNFSRAQRNVWCNVYCHGLQGLLKSISVHLKFSLYCNWSTLDFKTFLKHFLGRFKHIQQQLQNAMTSKIQ